MAFLKQWCSVHILGMWILFLASFLLSPTLSAISNFVLDESIADHKVLVVAFLFKLEDDFVTFKY